MAIDYTKEELLKKLKDFASLSEKDTRKKYGIKTDSRLWKLVKVKEFLKNTNIDPNYVMEMSYRPFDNRFTYYSKIKYLIAKMDTSLFIS